MRDNIVRIGKIRNLSQSKYLKVKKKFTLKFSEIKLKWFDTEIVLCGLSYLQSKIDIK